MQIVILTLLIVFGATFDSFPMDFPSEVRQAVRSASSAEISGPVFVGISSRRRDREEENAYALEHAAEQAARYQGFDASYVSITRDGVRARGVEHLEVNWNEAKADELLEEMDVVETFVNDRGTVVLATSDSLRAISIPVELTSAGQRPPHWITRAPSLGGLTVGVGVVETGRDLQRSVDRADAEALTEILRTHELSLIAEQYGDRRIRDERAVASVSRFYVVERYFSEDGRSLYSLAIAEID